jgi:hypothetical protein
MQNWSTASSNIWSNIQSKTSNFVSNLKQDTESKYNQMKDNATKALETLKDNSSRVWENIKTHATNVLTTIKEETAQKFESVKETMREKMDAAKTTMNNSWNTIKENAGQGATNVISKVKTNLSGLSDAITSPMDKAKTSIKNAISEIGNLFKNTKWKLPDIKVPKIKITGKFSLNPLQVPSFSISWNARGGIIDGITPLGFANGALQMGGEAGKEMVVPLENTSFTTKIAKAMGEAVDNAMARNQRNMNTSYNTMNDNRDIVLKINDREFARASISSINKLQRESGRTLLDI